MAILFLGMAFWIGGQTAWASTAVYSNSVLGYRVSYPDDMQLDQSLGNMCTVFRNGECQIEIYYQPLKQSSYLSYVNYSNSGFLQNRVDHQNC